MTQEKTTVNEVLLLEGEMTIFNAAAIREQLLNAMQDKAALEIDMSSVSEFDTSGLQIMVAAKKLAKQNNTRLKFTQMPNAVTELLELSRTAALIDG